MAHISNYSATNPPIESASVAGVKTAFASTTVEGATAQIDALKLLVDTLDASTIDCVAYSMDLVIWRMYAILSAEVLMNLATAVTIAFVVLTLFLHPAAVVAVVLIVALVGVDLAAGITLFNYTLNPITLGALTISVGLSLDYSAHIAHAFVGAHGTRKDRAKTALSKVGKAVVNGGTTTFLGLFVLYFGPADAFRSFAGLFMYMVALGEFHGLVVLPVILSLVGPETVEGMDSDTEEPTESGKSSAAHHVAVKVHADATIG